MVLTEWEKKKSQVERRKKIYKKSIRQILVIFRRFSIVETSKIKQILLFAHGLILDLMDWWHNAAEKEKVMQTQKGGETSGDKRDLCLWSTI